MAKKVSIEVGHGGVDSGATSNSIMEKNINLVVAMELKRQLERHGIDVLISRTKDVNDKAADFFPKAKAFAPDVGISVHANAFNGTAKGFEAYRKNDTYKVASDSLCSRIEAEVKVLGQTSRGIKDSGFLMDSLPCPTAYCELGFLDNPNDYKQFDTEAKQKQFGTAYAKGILKYFGLSWKDETPVNNTAAVNTTAYSTDVVYRVIAGSYSVKENAEAHASELQGKGVECFIAAYKL